MTGRSWVDRKEKLTAPVQQEQGIGAFASKCQPQQFDGEEQWKRMGSRVSQLVGTILWWCNGRNLPASGGGTERISDVDDLARTSLRFVTGFLRNNATELYHVLIMLTRGRAQRLVLKASDPEGHEAYRFLLWRYEPISTVTMVSKLVDLLATSFSRVS